MAGDNFSHRLARGTVVNAAGGVATKAMELLTVAVALGRIGEIAFGVFVLAQSVVQWPYMIESGVGQGVVRAIAGESPGDDAADLLSAAFVLYVLLAGITLVLGLSFSHTLLASVAHLHSARQYQAVRAFDLLALGGAVRMATSFASRAFVGKGTLALVRLTELIRTAVMLVGTLALVAGGSNGVVELAAASLAGDLAAAAGAFGLLRWRTGLRFSVKHLQRRAFAVHWQQSRPVLATNVLSLAWRRADPVIVSVAVGAAATATYGVAIRIYELLQGATELLSLGLMPIGAKVGRSVEQGRAQRLQAYVLLVTGLVVWPVAIVIGVYGAPAVRRVVGAPLPGLGPALAFAMALVVVMAPSAVVYYVITGAGRISDVVRVQAWASVMNLAVGVALVTSVGVSAVFVGSLLGTVLVTGRYLDVTAEVLGTDRLDLLRPLAKPSLLAAALAAVLLVSRWLAQGDGAVALVVVSSLAAYVVASVGCWPPAFRNRAALRAFARRVP